ncbi:MAG: YidC/Oxa1 family membrane protein insertase [Saccharofermentanales bacterium]|nr:YidC/Oxa1 family membrane protein insertase [Clostridiaceae bacterium]
MGLTVVSLGIFDPFYVAFGWFMKLLYDGLGNYGLVIIVFTIILRALMIPLGINQQKSSIKQQALQGEIAEIQRNHPNDKAKQSQLQMELYKKHGASPLSGCLPSIIQLIIILPIFQIIRAPLQYIMRVSAENLDKIGQLLHAASFITENEAKVAATQNIPLINALSDHASAFAETVNQGLMRVNQLLDLNFMGMNLGLIPTWRPALLFGADTWQTYLPLLAIPIIVLGTTIAQMKITRMTIPNRRKKAEDKAREKINPARAGQAPEDKTESMMKTMNIIMPIFMLWTTFSMPAALGLYWTIGNIMAILQSLLIYFLFTRKLEHPVSPPAQVKSTESVTVKS